MARIVALGQLLALGGRHIVVEHLPIEIGEPRSLFASTVWAKARSTG
jgi:hypothetical protein